MLSGCGTDPDVTDDASRMENPVGATEEAISSADTVVIAELDGPPVAGLAQLAVDEVLRGTVAEPLHVKLGEFDAPVGRRAMYVLSGDDPPRLLVDPNDGLLTPTRVNRVLAGGTLVSAAPATATLDELLATADGVALVSYRPAVDGRSAEVLGVDAVLAGVGPEPGDLLEVPDDADWDLTAGQERGHLMLVSTPRGWDVLAEPFGPGVAGRLDLSRVGR